jgi:hypothetical protein
MHEERGQSAALADMPKTPEKIRLFMERLRANDAAEWQIPLRTYQRWVSGDVPDILELLAERPDLVWMLVRDAERERAEGRAITPEPRPKKP